MGKRGPKSFAELSTIKAVRSSIFNNVAVIPPNHLEASTKRWYKNIVEHHNLESHELRTLQVAAESWDRKEQARKALAKRGLTYEDERGRVFARPEVGIERDARTSYFRALRELNLKVSPPTAEPY